MSSTIRTPTEISKIIGLIDDFSITKRSPELKIEWLRQIQTVVEDYISQQQDEIDMGARDEDN